MKGAELGPASALGRPPLGNRICPPLAATQRPELTRSRVSQEMLKAVVAAIQPLRSNAPSANPCRQ